MKTSPKTILILALPRHDGEFNSTPWQLAVEMARGNRVVYVDHPFSWLDAVKGFRSASIKKRWLAYWRHPSARKNGVEILFMPFVWPINFLPKGRIYNAMMRLNQRIIAARINEYLQNTGTIEFHYVNSFDFYLPDLAHLLSPKPQTTVYHCIDPMIKRFTLRHGTRLQERAARNSDVIISTAPALQRQFFKPGFPNSILVPNAANTKLFSEAHSSRLAIHPRLARIEGRVMGYLGNIERRTNFNLLYYTIESLQHWQLAMVGPYNEKEIPSHLKNHPRVHWVGPISHDEAPSVVKRFDVALIPFLVDSVSAGIYPLKLYEYLAAGKPVVTTNFNPEVLSTLRDMIHVANNDADFALGIQQAYASDDLIKARERNAFASKNSWSARAALFLEIIHAEAVKKDVFKKIH